MKPIFTLTDGMQADLALIERARSFFDSGMVPAAWLQEREERALLLEAYHSTRLAGFDITLEQAERFLGGGTVPEADTDGLREDLQVVADHVRTLAFVFGSATRAAVIDEGLICEIDAGVLRSTRAGERFASRYREAGRSLAERVAELAAWLDGDSYVHPVLRSGFAVCRLNAIRPFMDGNGRTARALSLLCLHRAGYTFVTLLSMSEYYERDRAAHSEALRTAQDGRGDATLWLEYFTHGLAVQSADLKERAGWILRRAALAERYALSARQSVALGWVLERGGITVGEYEGLMPDTGRRSLQRDLREMVGKGVLVPRAGVRGVVYRLRTAE